MTKDELLDKAILLVEELGQYQWKTKDPKYGIFIKVLEDGKPIYAGAVNAKEED